MYLHNCSADIMKQKKEVLERQQKTLEELSQRVPEVGHLAYPAEGCRGYFFVSLIWAPDYT